MQNSLRVKIKGLRSDFVKPAQATKGDAGWDLCLPLNDSTYIIEPHQTIKIPLGFATEFPEGWAAYVFARSGLSTKEGLRPGNCVGVIDASYRGEWIVALHNDSNKIRHVVGGQKVAQAVFMEIPSVEWTEADSLEESDRGEGGFGSTGR